METVGGALTVTVTLAEGAGVVVVPLTLAMPAVAVTFAVLLAVSVVVAVPLVPVVTTAGFTDPLSVLNVTGTPASTLPPESLTVAVIVERPPLEMVAGT